MKILSLVFPGFTLVDLAGPLQALAMLPDVEHQVVCGKAGPVLSDAGVTVVATHEMTDAWEDVDVLFVPGNTRSLFGLLHDRPTAEFLADRGSRANWVTSVCTGSLLLGVAGLLEGYRAGCHWYARELLTQYGAIPDSRRVVVDRNRITGGGMTAGLDFGLTLLGTLAGEQRGQVAELAMEYAPEPPYGTGRPEQADPATLAAAQLGLAARMPLQDAPPAPLTRSARPTPSRTASAPS